ncbi:hypothetical protein GCM10022381_32370 [Leifsonia kafniensis]|uniref:Uncharacterized protein n=1 Tax=Leifsonia kafniensis TaxID=475957 RepID=A0ABP7KWX9_9MICO
MQQKLQRLMAEAEAEARANETEAALLRKQGYRIVSEEWSALMAEAASSQQDVRRTQLNLINAKIEVSKLISGPRSRAFAAAGRQAADLVAAAERAREDALEKAMTHTAEINDATDEEARKRYQSALFSTTVFFDEVVRQAAELLEAAEADVSDLWKERAQRP